MQTQPSGRTIWLPLLFAVLLVTGMLIGMRLQSSVQSVQVAAAHPDVPGYLMGHGKIEELIRYIDAKYVDSVDREDLSQDAIEFLLGKLDPHSTYLSAADVQMEKERLDGSFEGIGVEFLMLEDTIRVITALSGGPSDAVGVLPGDRIVSINDTVVAGVNIETEEIMDLLRGPQGSQVRVGIVRGAPNLFQEFLITRDVIPMNSLEVAYMLDEETGYVKINRFSATTSTEFVEALQGFSENNPLKDLVIDLRQNPGGYLREATELLSQLFAERDKLLVYTQGRSSQRTEYKSTGRSLLPIRNVVVLIDEGSASASEIVAGAIQDYDRGILIGRRSFGKGLVQEQYNLRDGSALRLTVARYYTPSGRSIQKPYDDREEYEADVAHRMESGELYNGKTEASSPDTTQYFTSTGRRVYGGGGITPDVFVPLDSVFTNRTYIQLRALVPEFVLKNLNRYQPAYKNLALEEFLVRFQPTEADWNLFLDHVRTVEGKIPAQAGGDIRREVLLLIKARIAKHLYQDPGFYRVINQEDPDIQEAMRVLERENPLTILQDF